MLHAYCWPPSARPGDAVGLRVSAGAAEEGAPFEVEVARDGSRHEVVWTGRGVAQHLPIPDAASAIGCGWPDALQIPVGDWRSGYYAVTITSRDHRADAFLVVRPDPADPAPIVLVLATCTWNAYNDWAGPSLYTGGTRVSFDRPLAPGFLVKPGGARRKMQPEPDREALWFFDWAEQQGLSPWSGGAGWWNWERRFLRWAESHGFRVDVAVQQDLELHPEVLDDARLYLSVGHDEYWSWGMRDAVDAFAASGRNVAFFSGNTCYWQVRFEDDHHIMVGYKYGADADPVLGTPAERYLTSVWIDRRIGRPEFSTTGLSFSRGGYSRYGLGVPRASGAYTVWRPDHWMFEGTGVAYGDALGLADTIVAYEVDGCELELNHGLPVPSHRDGAPDGLQVLASAPAQLWTQAEQPTRYAHEPGELESVTMAIHGDDWREHLDERRNNHAVLGVFQVPGGGTVFNAGCTDWSYGLTGNDPDLERVTSNVLRRLSG